MRISIKRELTDEKLAYLFIGLYLILSFVWHFSTNAPWDDDCVGRYYNTKAALSDPAQFINRWNRPLFVLLFTIPFQISKHMILLMAVFSASGALALYRSAVLLRIRNAFLVVPMLLFQSFYFTASRSSLAEPLIAVILSYGLYLYLNKKWQWFAIVGSLIPLARLELTPFLLIWAFYLVREKQWKYIFILGIPTVLWNFTGTLLEGNWLWLVNETIGSDTGANRYGHTTFGHYFQRYIYVTGPFVFYFFIIGLFENIFRKKWHSYIEGQFILGFSIYVLFSWKLSLGQAAGFLRHLIALAPLVSLVCLQGFNYWYSSFVEKGQDGTIEGQENKEDTSEQIILDRISMLEKQLETGELKRKKARFEINRANKELKRLKENANTPEKKNNLFQNDTIRILIYSISLSILAYFFFQYKLLSHHNISEIKDYSNLAVILSLLIIYLGFKITRAQLKSEQLQKTIGVVLVLSMISFTLIKEPPNAHNSQERGVMTNVADIYRNSYLSKHATYVNHTWIAWAADFEQSDMNKLTKENLATAPDSSIVIWETHYSNRLSGDVPANYFTGKPEYIELIRFATDSMSFNVVIYQKLNPNRTKEEVLKVHDRFIENTTYQSEALLSKARNKWLYLKDKTGAIEDCKRSLEKDPNNNLALLEMANFLTDKKEYDKVDKYLQKVIELLPNYYYVYYKTGLNYSNQKKFTEALKYFNKSIDLKEEASSYVDRGNAYFNLKQYNKAIKDYEKSIHLKPDGYLGYYNIGASLLKQSRNEEACKFFKLALERKSPLAGNVIQSYCQ